MTLETEILEELKKHTTWLRLLGIQATRQLIKNSITTKTEMLIYELSNGTFTTREIAKKVNVSHATVANYWKKWAALGLVFPSQKYKGRYKRAISLRDLGLI